MKKLNILFLVIGSILLFSCTSSNVSISKAYPEFYRSELATILVMPPINNTNNVEAKEFFFTTLNQPLCEKGYYVIPPYLSMEIFKSESAYDADLFIDKPMDKFTKYFGADIILFTTIHKWEKNALLGNITVEVEYVAKSTKTNSIAYSRRGTMTLNTSSNNVYGGGLVGVFVNMAATAINTALTPHVKAARACNTFTFTDFPSGKYSTNYLSDSTTTSGDKVFNANVRVN